MLALALLLAGVSIALTLCLAAQWELTASDTIALGQLIVALFLIPLAVVAFWEARNALLQAAAKPILRFAFLGEDGLLYDEYTASLPAGGGSANRVTFAVENVGDAIAVWWQVSFDLPVKMMADFRRGEGKVFVRNRQVSISMDTVGNVERYVAQSAGTVGLFPGPPVQVAILDVQFDVFANTRFDVLHGIKYELLTDRSGPFKGELPLKIQVPKPMGG
jgi:hypothetical protein